jgi:hypothetical protein
MSKLRPERFDNQAKSSRLNLWRILKHFLASPAVKLRLLHQALDDALSPSAPRARLLRKARRQQREPKGQPSHEKDI